MQPVEITSRELYQLTQQLHTRVIVLCEKIDNLGPDHEARIRALEKSRWPLPAIATLVSVSTLAVLIWNMMGSPL